MSARTARIEVLHELGAQQRDAVYALVADVQARTGHRPLSDHLWLDLVHGGRSWHTAVLATDPSHDDHSLLAYAQLSSGPGHPRTWAIELVVDPSLTDSSSADSSSADSSGADGTERTDSSGEVRHLAARVLAEAHAAIAAAGGGHVHWWVFDPGPDADALAEGIGLTRGRTLYQMRVALPLAATTDVSTRPFEIGRDEQAWLEVNNSAFAEHAEQGSWDLTTLQLREREDWFDPQGFLLHERDGRLAAFCWTKLHHDTDPVLGEIYVIAVHPDFHGLGLGKALTVAGLSSIASRGVTTGMLYVDHHNTAAVGLYRSLGFTVHRTDRAYVGDIPPAAVTPSEEEP